jgi:prepilin peptidase CpaA
MGGLFHHFAAGALALLLVSAGIQDARSREIANWKNAAIALLAPLWWWANGLALWPDVAIQLGVAALVFAFFVGAFAIGQMGGGDVKMIGALAVAAGAAAVWMLVLMSLLGGALTLIMVADRKGCAAGPWLPWPATIAADPAGNPLWRCHRNRSPRWAWFFANRSAFSFLPVRAE